MAGALDVLVLGGTSWLGGAVARHALARGHRVTCLARGQAGTPPDGITWSRADRSCIDAYDEVRDRRWDAVVEVSWQPDLVRSALDALARQASHWVYVSSCSVYSDDGVPGQDESAPVHEPFGGTGPVDWDVYGPAKVACEQATLSALGGDRVLVARAGLIGGYGDRSDRLGYWPTRMARASDGERVLVPPLSGAVQVVDVEDLASWLVTAAESRTPGTLNAIGDETTLAEVLAASVAVAGTRPELVEIADDRLAELHVQPWAGPESLPLWLPQPDHAGFLRRRNTAARAAGLRLRPVAETMADALVWERELGLERERTAGLGASHEATLLDLLP